MYGELIAGVVVALGVVVSYLERKSLKADVVKAKADVEAAGEKFLSALRVKESQVRARISADVAKVIAEAKVEAAKVDSDVKAIVVKIEADLKKVL